MLRIEPDMRIESERLSSLGAEISAKAFAADAPDNFTDQPSDAAMETE
jgi:hypothetical protein